MATVERAQDPSWGDVVIKEAVDPAGRARLAREAAVLDRARHPGVVELVRHHDEDGRAVLVTRNAGTRTVADLPELGSDQVAAFGAAVAQTLADLHRAGVSHGAVRAEHVVLSDLGQPVLCGLADAGLVEPPEGQWGGFDPASDIGALADVLAGVLEPAEGLRRWSGGVGGLLRRADERSMDQLAAELAGMAGAIRPPLRLAAVAAAADSEAPTIDLTVDPAVDPPPDPQATTRSGDDPGVRVAVGAADMSWLDEHHLDDHPFWDGSAESDREPLALGDAATVDRLFAPARSFGPRPPRPAPPAGGRWTARRLIGVAALALLAVVAGASTVAALGRSEAANPTSDSAPAGDSTSSSAAAAGPAPVEPALATSETGGPAPASLPATAPASCPTSHDEAALVGVPSACADRLSTSANLVSVGDVRWAVGTEADLVAAGDFDCDGWLEVASLDAQGDVAVFDRWAGGGQEPTGRILQRVPAARALVSTARDQCHELVVERTDLPPVTVPVVSGR